MSKLAINGGTPVRTSLFPLYNTIGPEEKAAVASVMESGVLSQFLGSWHEDFYGGPWVRRFEKDFADLIGVRHSISVNSNTSGLYAAVGACGVGPGDEVIVSPYTMTASAIAPLIYGAVPVFADIDEETFGLRPDSIEARITPRTRAILVVHIFGHPADMDPIMAIARRHNLKVIEDCAQAPLTRYKGRWVGTIGDLGIFSFNYHKHVHTGEGGLITTNDDVLAEKCQLIRNHGEEVVEKKGTEDIHNTFGFNYRLTEPHAAIGVEQLKKLPALMSARRERAARLSEAFGRIPGLVPPVIREGSEHAFYLMATRYKADVVGVPRNRFIDAVKAEIPSAVGRETTPILGAGYVRPLYLQPIYQRRLGACSFNCPRYEGEVSYARGLCPVAERMHYDELFTNEFIRPSMRDEDLQDVVRAFEKVYEHRAELSSAPVTA
jgi:perosamine synthetase